MKRVHQRPILFSAPMINAIKAGRKTQTRRLQYIIRKGQQLWVKETWATDRVYDSIKPSELPIGCPIIYIADGESPQQLTTGRTRSPLFMPRWASRLLLDVKSIKAEKLQSISLDDAKAEGFDSIESFATAWNKMHGADAWQSNPHVFVIEFNVCQGGLS